MQTVILAGGLAKRLRPVSWKVPKLLIPINGKPFLLYLLDLLKNNGLTDIVLCIGNLGDQIKDFIRDGKERGVKIRYSHEKDNLLGTGGALKQAQSLLDKQFLVLNGDTYLPIDYRDVVSNFCKSGKKGLVAVYNNRENTSVLNNVDIDEGSLMVTGYNKDGGSALKYVDAGVLALHREALDLIEAGEMVSLEEGIFLPLIEQRELIAYISGERFYDVGTLERIKQFEAFVRER